MSICPSGRPPVPLSHFEHDSGWEETAGEMRRKPLFCAERIDINGDGRPDEVGYSTETRCDSSLDREDFSSETVYRNHQAACYHDEYVPFTLAGDPKDGSVTVWLDPASETGARKATFRPGDHFLGRDNSILTYDPSRLVARKSGRGILGLTSKVASLLNAVKSMGWGERLHLAGLVAGYLASPSQAKIAAGINFANGKLDQKDRLTPNQVWVLASLSWKYRDRIVRVLTDPEGLRSASYGERPYPNRPITRLERYVAILQGRPLGNREGRIFPLNILAENDFDWFEAGSLASDLRVNLNGSDLIHIDRHFSAVNLAATGYELPLHKTLATLRPVPGSPNLGTHLFAFRESLEEACRFQLDGEAVGGPQSSAVPAVITGYYEFTQGDLPPGEMKLRGDAADVVLDDGTQFTLSATRLFFPVWEIPVEHVVTPWLDWGQGDRYRGINIRIGSELEIYPLPLPEGGTPEQSSVTVTQIYWDDDEHDHAVVARDAEGRTYRAHDQYSGEIIWEAIPADLSEPSQPIRVGDHLDISLRVGPWSHERTVEAQVRITDIAWAPFDRGGYYTPFDRGDMYLVYAEDAEGRRYEGTKYVFGDMKNADRSYYANGIRWSYLDSQDFSCGPAPEQSE